MQENNELLTYSPEEIEQLITLVEELQTENEQFRMTITNQKKQIQTISSDRQKLSEKVRKQMSQIQQQAEIIEKLNGSDLELKKAEDLKNRLKEKEKHWKNEIKRSQEEASHFKRQAETTISQANSKKANAEKKKAEYDSLIVSQKKLTEKRVEELNDQFRIKSMDYAYFDCLQRISYPVYRL